MKITSLKLYATLSKFLPDRAPTIARSHWSPRTFAVASTKPLQSDKQEKETAETCEKVTEAAEAVKEGAKEVRKTTEFVRDMAASTAKNVTKMSKDVTEKVTEATDKVKDTMGGAWGTAKATTEFIKDKVGGK